MTEAVQTAAKAPLDASNPYATRSSQHYALVVLLLIYTCHGIDRGIVGIVTEPIRKEFGATDSQIGLITLAYTLAFVLAMLPIGVLIDRTNRLRLLAVLVTAWSGLTALAGFAGGIGSLVAARMGVGAAEAGGHPTSMSLLSDIFPKERRGSAIGIFYIASGMGGMIAFLGGGFLAAAYGWRATFFIAGVPGLLMAVVAVLTLREPKRGGADGPGATTIEKAPPVLNVLKFIVATPALTHLAIGVMVASAVNGSYASWLSSYFIRTHELDLKQVGIVGALGHGALQVIGALISGFLADWFGRRGTNRAGYVASVAMFMLAPLGVAFALTPSTSLAIGLSLVIGVFAGAWMAPTFTLVVSLTESRMRGVVVSLIQVLAAIGAGLGPFIVGTLSDAFGGKIHIALAMGMGISVWAALHSFLGTRMAARMIR